MSLADEFDNDQALEVDAPEEAFLPVEPEQDEPVEELEIVEVDQDLLDGPLHTSV